MNDKENDIFISYSRKNKDLVLPIKDEIERSLDLSCWIDLSDIPSGDENFKRRVIPGINETRVAFLFFLSKESQASEYAMKEIGFAKKRAKKRVILVRLNDDAMTDEFYFDYQDADVIDWRVPEQRGKLFRDLSSWAGRSKPAESAGINRTDAPPEELSVRPSESVKSRLKNLTPSEEEGASGFRVIDFGDDVILTSDRLDDALQRLSADGLRMVSLPAENPFSDALRKVNPIAERVLAWKRGQRGDRFHNDAKIGLASDLLLDVDGAPPNSLSVFRTDYFSSFRTNEMATLDVDVAKEGEISDDWWGVEHFPWLENPDGSLSMRSFAIPGFSNHLGGNTLGVTDDGMLVLWIQSPLAERSQNRWAPTGSGSLDWSDLDLGGSFLQTVANGATRELREECRIRDDDSIRVETKILGYYRWCGRGGLPGFLCASRIGCPASRLSPDPEEVCIARERPLIGLRTARTRENLARTVDDLLNERAGLRHSLSTPLRANLLVLRRALSTNASGLDFLFG